MYISPSREKKCVFLNLFLDGYGGVGHLEIYLRINVHTSKNKIKI